MIKIYNRKTGEYEVEKVAGGGLLDTLYGSRTGKVGLELLVKRKVCSSLTGMLCNTRLSAGKIKGFIENFSIDISEAADGVESFKNFNEFFTRKLKPSARSFNQDRDMLVSPGDGRLRAWENIDIDGLIQVKDITYSLGELLNDRQLAQKYKGGTCVLLRLAPVDYHRFHFIDGGTCSESRKIKGKYYSVNPVALKSIPRVFCLNKREYSIQRSDNFGDVLYMEVGATSVGSIVQTYSPVRNVSKGEEKGYFKFGGSTTLLFLEPGKARIDEDILKQTEMGFEVRILAGETIGHK
ncbi:MAG: phosphatidylserine decarboxylase [Bacillota bacterium]|nr:phosphatidylserine decarboxylase [Bacillota bacterium]